MLLIVTGGQKSNFNGGFKLTPMIYYENIVDVAHETHLGEQYFHTTQLLLNESKKGLVEESNACPIFKSYHPIL